MKSTSITYLPKQDNAWVWCCFETSGLGTGAGNIMQFFRMNNLQCQTGMLILESDYQPRNLVKPTKYSVFPSTWPCF